MKIIYFCLILTISSLTLASAGPQSLSSLLRDRTIAGKVPQNMFYQGGSEEKPNEELCPDSLFGEILDKYPNKYPWESHRITTEDGYILRAFRI